jgi:hypothetical protein
MTWCWIVATERGATLDDSSDWRANDCNPTPLTDPARVAALDFPPVAAATDFEKERRRPVGYAAGVPEINNGAAT